MYAILINNDRDDLRKIINRISLDIKKLLES